MYQQRGQKPYMPPYGGLALFRALMMVLSLGLSWQPSALALAPMPALQALMARAASGEVQAEYELGCYLLEFHERSPANPKAAVDWLVKAATHGSVPAMWRLSQLPGSLLEPTGRTSDEWLEAAAAKGDRAAALHLAEIRLDRAYDAAAQTLALTQFERLARSGHTQAAISLSNRFQGGIGVKKDPVRALEWAKVAAQSPDEDGKTFYARLLFRGAGQKPRRQEALALFRTLKDTPKEVTELLAFLKAHTGSDDASLDGLLKTLEQRARRGEVKAMLDLARYHSLSLPFDQDAAVRYLARAANAGDVDSLLKVADMSMRGLAPKTDFNVWHQRILVLAKGGNTRAQGLITAWGLDSPAYEVDVRRELELAAAKQDRMAMFVLARAYTWGDEVPKDLNRGYQILMQAAALGYPEAEALLALYYEYGWSVPKDPKEAVRLLLKAGPGYELELAKLYADPASPAANIPEALRIYRKLVEEGKHEAMVGMGRLYEQGLGVPQDYQEAFNWYYELYARVGDTALMDEAQEEANFRLGNLYELGLGRTPDLHKAKFHYQQAGTAEALLQLGLMYEEGRGIPIDLPTAYMAYLSARLKGSEAAEAAALRVRSDLTEFEIEQAEQKRFFWYDALKDQDE